MVFSLLPMLALLLAAEATTSGNEPQQDIIIDLLSELPEGYEDRGWISRCPPDLEKTLTSEKILWDNLVLCLTSNYDHEVIRQEIYKPNTTEEIRSVFKHYCAYQPNVYQCFDNLTSISEACLNTTQQVLFNVNEHNFKLAYNIFCHQDGERMAVLRGEGKGHVRSSDIRSCVKAMIEEVEPFSISVDTLKEYRALKSFKECITALRVGEDLALSIGEEVLDEFLRGMHCTGQDQGSRKCEGLDTVA